MTKDEALRMALEALEIGKPMFDAYWGGSQFNQAITAIKEALAQPKKDIPKIGCVNHDCDKCKAQPEQEPVAWGNLANWCLDSDRVLLTDKDEAAKYHRDVYDLTPLYTTPPYVATPRQRTWVGLTDEEVNELVEHTECEDYYGLVEATEAKLKEKNT